MVLDYRRIKVREVVETVGISVKTVDWSERLLFGIVNCVHHYLQTGEIITEEYCTSLLDKQKPETAKKTTAFEEEESAFPSRQRAFSHFDGRHG